MFFQVVFYVFKEMFLLVINLKEEKIKTKYFFPFVNVDLVVKYLIAKHTREQHCCYIDGREHHVNNKFRLLLQLFIFFKYLRVLLFTLQNGEKIVSSNAISLNSV